MIEIITNGRCPRCVKLHLWLKQKGFQSSFIYLSEGIEIPENMGKSLPIVKIGETWIKYSPNMLQTIIDEFIKIQANTKQDFFKKDQ